MPEVLPAVDLLPKNTQPLIIVLLKYFRIKKHRRKTVLHYFG